MEVLIFISMDGKSSSTSTRRMRCLIPLHIVARQHAMLGCALHCSHHPALIYNLCIDDFVSFHKTNFISVSSCVVIDCCVGRLRTIKYRSNKNHGSWPYLPSKFKIFSRKVKVENQNFNVFSFFLSDNSLHNDNF